jgi:hypothetical protein
MLTTETVKKTFSTEFQTRNNKQRHQNWNLKNKNSLNNSKLHETITIFSQLKIQQNIHFNSPLPPLPQRRIPEHFKN